MMAIMNVTTAKERRTAFVEGGYFSVILMLTIFNTRKKLYPKTQGRNYIQKLKRDIRFQRHAENNHVDNSQQFPVVRPSRQFSVLYILYVPTFFLTL